MKYLCLFLLPFFIVGCSQTRQNMPVVKQPIPQKEVKEEKIIEMFSKKFNLAINTKNKDENLFEIGFRHFKGDK